MPNPPPHLTIPSLPNTLTQWNLFRQSALYQQRQSRPTPWRHRVLQILPQSTIPCCGSPQQLISRIIRIRILFTLVPQAFSVHPTHTPQDHCRHKSQHQHWTNDSGYHFYDVEHRFGVGFWWTEKGWELGEVPRIAEITCAAFYVELAGGGYVPFVGLNWRRGGGLGTTVQGLLVFFGTATSGYCFFAWGKRIVEEWTQYKSMMCEYILYKKNTVKYFYIWH